MRTAYVVFNHRPPAQLERLLTTLREQDSDAVLVVHHDRFRYPHDLSLSPDLRAMVLTWEEAVTWGDFSLVEMSWRALHWVRENVDFDWLVMLSAQDYPIRPLSEINDVLANSGFDAFVEATPIEEIEDAALQLDTRFRYLFQYLTPSRWRSDHHLPKRVHSMVRAVASTIENVINRFPLPLHSYRYPDPMPTRFGVRSRSTPFTPQFRCWKGSTWAVLNQRAVNSVLDFADANTDFVDYFRRVAIPDEATNNTILCNDSTLRIDHRGLHLIHWTSSESSHPDVLGIEDFDAITSSPYLFARKFDVDVDVDILDRLDRHNSVH